MKLIELLDAGAAHDAEYAAGLSNHRPMALLALAGLGADDQCLQAFAAVYDQRLRPVPQHTPWPAGLPWAARLGERAAWPAYRDLFLHWLISEDAGDVLRQALPVLMRGCGGAAFHGLIRTAYAVQAQHRRELADALAYWAACWMDLGPQPQGNAPDVSAALRRLPALPGRFNLIADAMAAAARQPGFDAAVGSLQVLQPGPLPASTQSLERVSQRRHKASQISPKASSRKVSQQAPRKASPPTLQTLATLAAGAYAATRNFAVLHLVTSAHAVRLLLPYIDEAVPALLPYWRAYAAAVCGAGLVDGAAPVPWPWPDIVRAACATTDDHVVKLVYSCQQQQAAYGDSGVWQAAATRAVQL